MNKLICINVQIIMYKVPILNLMSFENFILFLNTNSKYSGF